MSNLPFNLVIQVIWWTTVLKRSLTAWKASKQGLFSGPYFRAFGLKTERYSVTLRIQSECGKIRTRTNSVFGHFSRNAFVTNDYNHTSLNIISLQQFFTKFRSSHQRCSMKKGVLKNFVKFKGKYLYLFALKRGSGTGVFLWILSNF